MSKIDLNRTNQLAAYGCELQFDMWKQLSGRCEKKELIRPLMPLAYLANTVVDVIKIISAVAESTIKGLANIFIGVSRRDGALFCRGVKQLVVNNLKHIFIDSPVFVGAVIVFPVECIFGAIRPGEACKINLHSSASYLSRMETKWKTTNKGKEWLEGYQKDTQDPVWGPTYEWLVGKLPTPKKVSGKKMETDVTWSDVYGDWFLRRPRGSGDNTTAAPSSKAAAPDIFLKNILSDDDFSVTHENHNTPQQEMVRISTHDTATTNSVLKTSNPPKIADLEITKLFSNVD